MKTKPYVKPVKSVHERLCEQAAFLFRVFKEVSTPGNRFFDPAKIPSARMAYYRSELLARRAT